MSSNNAPKLPKLSPANAIMRPLTDNSESPVNDAPVEVNLPEPITTSDENEISTNATETSINPSQSEVAHTDNVLVSEDSYPEEVSDTTPTQAEKRFDGGPWEIIKYTGFLPVILWALLSAAATGVAAYYFTPGDYTWIPLTILGFMTGVIAAVDNKTHLIKNQHTIITAVATVPLAVWVAFTLGFWNFLFGIISALVIFGVFIFLVQKVNFGSGGDIKFSPVPAFVLGVVNPLIPMVWMFSSMVISLIVLVVLKKKRVAFGTGMALSLPLALATIYGLYALSGLTYI